MSTVYLIPALATGFALLFVAGQTTHRRMPHFPAWHRMHAQMHAEPAAAAHVAPGPGSVTSIAAAPELTDDDLRRERALGDEERFLDEARRAVAPFLTECDDALSKAITDFRIGMWSVRRTLAYWHAHGQHVCKNCHPRVLPTHVVAEALLGS